MHFIYNKSPKEEHLTWLDGVRGIASIWVMLSHIQILTGLAPIPILSWGWLAVDVFMMLSGFLMAHHYILRQHKEPWQHPKTVFYFWLRRFFRIAPLYYLLLAVALLAGPLLGEFRADIATIWPLTATPPQRYTDSSISNIIMHLTFAFGLSPFYAFHTALPDWSIGLEMQFYLAFPFIMWLFMVSGPVISTILLMIVCGGVQYLWPNYWSSFEMPAFLLMKLPIFLIGILIACGKNNGEMKRYLLYTLLLVMGLHFVHPIKLGWQDLTLAILMFYLTGSKELPGSNIFHPIFSWLRQLLACRLAVFLGATSYSVYLLHLMVVIPVAGYLSTMHSYLMLNQYVRFIVVVVLVTPVVYAIAWLLYNKIELVGIKIGKWLIASVPA